jgi:hypothetical protein
MFEGEGMCWKLERTISRGDMGNYFQFIAKSAAIIGSSATLNEI